jgi:hypothetical protein
VPRRSAIGQVFPARQTLADADFSPSIETAEYRQMGVKSKGINPEFCKIHLDFAQFATRMEDILA